MYTLYVMTIGEQNRQPTGGAREPALRQNADFARLWTGGAVSDLGSSMTASAYPLLALSITPSAAAAGLLGLVALTVGALSRLPAGVAIDRAPLRWMLIGSDLISVAATSVAVVSLLTGRLALWQLLVVAAVYAAGAAVNDIAHSVALASRRFSPTQLPHAFALNEGRGTRLSWPANRSVASSTASRP